MLIVFNETGDFEANTNAENWCKKNNISYGTMQGGDSRGLKKGKYNISKWSNLSPEDIASLDGTMTGNMRNGPIEINITDLDLIP